MALNRYLILLFFVFTSNQFLFGQGSYSNDCKTAFKQNLLLNYIGDYIPIDSISKYDCIFSDLLKNRIEIQNIVNVQAFPVNLDDSIQNEIEFKYCVLVLKTKQKNNQICNVVFVYDSSLNRICRKDFLGSKDKIHYSDVVSVKDGIFKVIYFETKKQVPNVPPRVKKEYLFYFDHSKKLQSKKL